MASISGMGGLGGASSIRGYGGLASGLDRDSLIENMTYATRSKIAQQKQKKQSVQWEQIAMRNLTSKMVDFSNKFTSFSSPSNLLGSKLFSRTQISAVGENSKYLSVSGTAASSNTMSILGVKQMAQNAQISTTKEASDQSLTTGSISTDLATKGTDVSLVSGKSMAIKYGNKTFHVNLKEGEGYDYKDAASTAESINKAMKEVSIGNEKTLADVVKIEVDGNDVMTFKSLDTAGNKVALAKTSGDLLEKLGFVKPGEKFDELSDDRKTITSSGLVAQEKSEVTEKQSLAQVFSEKKISFAYNGTVKWITLGKFDEATATPEAIQNDLQNKLNEAFGKDRVSATIKKSTDGSSFNFEFKTTKPVTKQDSNGQTIRVVEDDSSSTITINSADKELIGSMGVLDISKGSSNRLNLSSSIDKSGLAGLNNATWDANGEMQLKINDADITIKKTDSISDIIKKINEDPNSKVTVTYQANSDRFLLSSTEKGAGGNIELSGEGAKLFFGDASTHAVTDGKDAVILVQYAGDSGATEITRDSNTMTVDGLNITLKGTFGFDSSGNAIANTEAVTFDAQVDTETTTKAVKEMIAAYNEMLEMINSEVSQKPNRNYQPLTDEQRAEMSESQIEKWEEEAKKGLLFNDSDLRSLMNDLRFVLPSQDREALSKMGITVSNNYEDNGKLVLDEDKFKAALSSDPDQVRQIFTRKASVDENGASVEGGLMTKMKSVMDRFASTTGATKGILIERAGSIHAPTSVLSNSFQKQIDSIDEYIEKLDKKLKMEQDRYVSQFTALETAISQMNSQSSYLNGMFGGA